MTIEEYAALAQRTASTKTAQDKIGHGCLGLIGEAGEIVDIIKKQKYMGMSEELAREKLIDEAGDFAWYLVELCTGLDLDVEETFIRAAKWHTDNETVEEAAADLAVFASTMYDGDLERMTEICRRDTEETVTCYLDLLNFAKIDAQEVLTHNIEKLKKRYPEGFDAERSNGRYYNE